MVYTEIKKKNNKKYYYRVRSIRLKNKFKKERVYLGVNLDKDTLRNKEVSADTILLEKKIKQSLGTLPSKIRMVLKRNNVKRAGIFGSYARGDQKKTSDIDILIEPPKGIGFGFARIGIELSEALKKKVDLVSYNGLSAHLKDKILEQEVRIL